MAARPLATRFKALSQLVGMVTMVLLALQGGFSMLGAQAASTAQQASPSSVPPVFNFQGVARDAEGKPLASGEYSMTFRIYDGMTGATPLWEENQTGVAVRDGRFSATLGLKTSIPATLFGGADRFVGVTVGNGAELQPRQRLSSVPYAVNADTLDGFNSTAFAPISHQHQANQIVGELTDGQVTNSLTLTAGSINGVPVGQTARAPGSFTSLNADSLMSTNAVTAGSLASNGGLAIKGDLTVDGQKPFQVLNVRGGDDLRASTGIPASDWHCFVAGFEAQGGDIYEGSPRSSTENLIAVYTYIENGIWHARGDFRSHQTNESLWSIVVLCANKKMVTVR